MDQDVFFENLSKSIFSENLNTEITPDDLIHGMVANVPASFSELFLSYDKCNLQMMDLVSSKDMDASSILDFAASFSPLPTFTCNSSDLLSLDCKHFREFLDEVLIANTACLFELFVLTLS